MPNRFWKCLRAKKTFLKAHEDNQEAVFKLTTKQKKQKRAPEKRRRRQDKRAKVVLLLLRKKTMDKQYLKRPALFGNSAQLQTPSNLSFGIIKSYLETKPSFTKYRPIRLRFPRLKKIKKDIIKKIRSGDLVYVDTSKRTKILNIFCLQATVCPDTFVWSPLKQSMCQKLP